MRTATVKEKQAFRRLVRQVLARRKMTAAELSRCLGIHRSTVSLWLSGERYPGLETRLEVEKILKKKGSGK